MLGGREDGGVVVADMQEKFGDAGDEAKGAAGKADAVGILVQVEVDLGHAH